MSADAAAFDAGVLEGFARLKDRIASVGSSDLEKVLKKFTRNIDVAGPGGAERRLGYLCGLISGVNALGEFELELRRPEPGISEWSLRLADRAVTDSAGGGTTT